MKCVSEFIQQYPIFKILNYSAAKYVSVGCNLPTGDIEILSRKSDDTLSTVLYETVEDNAIDRSI